MDSLTRSVVLAVPVFAVFVGLILHACAANPAPRTLRAAAVDEALCELWIAARPGYREDTPREKMREWQMKLTTWLPGEWPPTPQTVWTRYAYGLDVTLDGSAGVSAPFARLERRAGEDPNRVLTPMARSLKVIAIHPVRPHGGWNYTLADEKRVLAHALSLTAAPPAEARGALGLVSYYQAWRLGSAEIAAHVAPQHRAFFAWLDAQR